MASAALAMPTQNAVAKASKKAITAVSADPNHGKYIFIYSNIWTNQVIYSLHRSLYNHGAIKQLPNAGKNTIPRALRKDLWRPLLTVTFPSTQQGHQAYRRLLEYQKLYAANRQDFVPERIPSKDEEPELGVPERNVLSLEKQRRYHIMNQKAQSIANLAAVLTGQEKWRKQLIRQHKEWRAKMEPLEDAMWEKIEALAAKATPEHLATLQRHIKAATAAKHADIAAGKESEENPSPKRDRHIKSMRDQLSEITRARAALKTREKRKNRINPWNAFYGPGFARRGWGRHLSKQLEKKQRLPKLGDVTISWADIMDAEFAREWPTVVEHTRMGLFRHTAPDPDSEPLEWEVDQAEELFEEDVEETGADEVDAEPASRYRSEFADERVGYDARDLERARREMDEELKPKEEKSRIGKWLPTGGLKGLFSTGKGKGSSDGPSS